VLLPARAAHLLLFLLAVPMAASQGMVLHYCVGKLL